MTEHLRADADPNRETRETLRNLHLPEGHEAVAVADIAPEWEISIHCDVDDSKDLWIDPCRQQPMRLTGEITVYYTDPLLYAAMVSGQKLLDEWIDDMLQERVDEEGCGVTINAMREWGDD